MRADKQLAKNFNKRFAKKQNALMRVPAEMGDGIGNLNVEGMNGFIYVRINGKPVAVYNDRVPNQDGTAVWVGYAPEEPTKFQVLSTRSDAPSGENRGWLGYAPARRYEWHAPNGGQDPVYIHQRALTFLRLSVSGLVPETFEVYVNVYSGRIWSGTEWLAVARQDVDIYEHIPTTSGKAAFVLFTIDTSGAVVTTKGDEVDIDALALSDIPDAPANTSFICGAVRVYEGQTVVKEGRTNTDFVDLRWSSLAMFSLSAAWDSITDKPSEFPPDADSTYYTGRTIGAGDPTVDDDDTEGILPLHWWLSLSTNKIFFCLDNSTGAAVWVEIGGGSGMVQWVIDGAIAISDPCDVPHLITGDYEAEKAYINLEYLGTSGTTEIDIELDGSGSILTAPIEIDYDAADKWTSATLSTTSFSEGDILIPIINGVAVGAYGLRIIIPSTGGSGGGSFNLTVENADASVSVSNVGKIIAPTVVNNGGGEVDISTPYVCIQDQKTQNTSGGTFTSGAWRTRDLNTEVSDPAGVASVSSNQITLDAGTYIFNISAPAFKCNRHQAKLYNVTDAADVAFGTAEYAGSADDTGNRSIICGRFTIATSKTFEVRHQCQTTSNPWGLGVEANFGTEVYTIAEFWKVG